MHYLLIFLLLSFNILACDKLGDIFEGGVEYAKKSWNQGLLDYADMDDYALAMTAQKKGLTITAFFYGANHRGDEKLIKLAKEKLSSTKDKVKSIKTKRLDDPTNTDLLQEYANTVAEEQFYREMLEALDPKDLSGIAKKSQIEESLGRKLDIKVSTASKDLLAYENYEQFLKQNSSTGSGLTNAAFEFGALHRGNLEMINKAKAARDLAKQDFKDVSKRFRASKEAGSPDYSLLDEMTIKGPKVQFYNEMLEVLDPLDPSGMLKKDTIEELLGRSLD